MRASKGQNGEVTIAFDTWPLMSCFRKTGIYVYARNLLAHFQEQASSHSVEIRPFISRRISNEANQIAPSRGLRPYRTNLLRIGRVWRYGGACLSAFNSKADLLFCPAGTTLPLSGLVRVVATIHDVIPVVFPDLPKARALGFEFGNSAKFSHAIITDSLHSKQDLVNVFRISPAKVHVVYLACDETVFNDVAPDPALRDKLLNKLGLKRPYILHHGRIQERKNLKRLIQAYRLLLSRNRNLDFDLVLLGELGWQHEVVIAEANVVQPRGRVVFAGPLDDPELAILLKTATLSVIPSLYEGFCLPLLEAMACGTPTICSNSTCLPEISGDSLRYFDPLSVDEMANCMEQVLESGTLRQTLALKGKGRASAFSWRRCAEETLAVLKSAAAN